MKNKLGFEPLWPTVDGKPPAGVKAFVTTRPGGKSLEPFAKNNLALHVGDNPDTVQSNRNVLAHSLNLGSPIMWLNQTHSDHVVCFDDEFNSAQTEMLSPIDADGAMTTGNQHVCAVMTADCLPLLLCDSEGMQVAAIHAGWRGLANGILKKAVELFQKNFSTESKNTILAYIGPAISQPYYEVGREVVDALQSKISLPMGEFAELVETDSQNESFSLSKKDSQKKYLLDMVAVAKAQLNEAGVDKISGGDRCTFAEQAAFYSYRRDGKTGRIASLIWLEK